MLSVAAFISENDAKTFALSAPERISSLDVLSPRTALIESITIDLPAPVSPVMTFRPGSNSISTLSITAIFSIFRPTNINIFCSLQKSSE